MPGASVWCIDDTLPENHRSENRGIIVDRPTPPDRCAIAPDSTRSKATRPRPRFDAIVDSLAMAILVFRNHQLIYSNRAAERLRERMRTNYRSELTVLLRDHLGSLPDKRDGSSTVTLLTGGRGEPFHVHVIPIDARGIDVAISVRELGTALGPFRDRYGLSRREAEVAELVLLGYRNRDIALTLRIAPATIKKHLTHVFDKVGVDTRTQLVARLA